MAFSIPAKEPPCVGGGATFHIFGIVGHCQPLPPLYHAFFSLNGTPPLSWDLNFGCRQQKGNIAIHKIQSIPNRVNPHLIILKREPHAYAGPTVSTFFQYRKSSPIIFSSKLHIFCYKRFCPRGTLNGISLRVLLPLK